MTMGLLISQLGLSLLSDGMPGILQGITGKFGKHLSWGIGRPFVKVCLLGRKNSRSTACVRFFSALLSLTRRTSSRASSQNRKAQLAFAAQTEDCAADKGGMSSVARSTMAPSLRGLSPVITLKVNHWCVTLILLRFLWRRLAQWCRVQRLNPATDSQDIWTCCSTGGSSGVLADRFSWHLGKKTNTHTHVLEVLFEQRGN